MYMLKSLAVMLGLAATHAYAEANGDTSTVIFIHDTALGWTQIDVTYNRCASVSPQGRIVGYKMTDSLVSCKTYVLPHCQGPSIFWKGPSEEFEPQQLESILCFRP